MTDEETFGDPEFEVRSRLASMAEHAPALLGIAAAFVAGIVLFSQLGVDEPNQVVSVKPSPTTADTLVTAKDIPLFTNDVMNGDQALGGGVVRFDADMGCVYLEGNGRLAPIWPPGYTASAPPLEIRNAAGQLVAREGTSIWTGGGYLEFTANSRDQAETTKRCGAGTFWNMSSEPKALTEPVEVTKADVPLLTGPVGGMLALGGGAVLFDSDLNCVYIVGGAGRVVAVWPPGYTASASPLEVRNAAGELVAREGDRIQVAGGYLDVSDVDPDDRCGANGSDGLFRMSGEPPALDPP